MRINTRRLGGLASYVTAHRRAHTWAEKAIVHRTLGNFEEAQAAVKKVNSWLRKIALMEAARLITPAANRAP
jgi:hypothetical protein